MSMLLPGTGIDGLETDGTMVGVAIGVVTTNTDDSGMGRVRVRFPWRLDSQQSYWARVASPMAGGKRGVYFLPEVGDEVLVAFDRGDIGFPYVVGALWNGKDSAPLTNTDGKNDVREIRSRQGHELIFDDGDKPKVELRTAAGKHVVMDDDGIEIEDGAGNSLVIASNGGDMTLTCSGTLKIDATSVEITAKGQMKLSANGTLTINGTLVQIN